MVRHWLFLLSSLLSSICLVPESPAAMSDGLSFLALGDSYTIGQSVPAQDRWPQQLAVLLRDHGCVVQDPRYIARTGWTTDELTSAMHQEALTGTFDLVTIQIGVNDQYRGRSVAAYRDELLVLLHDALALAHGVAGHVVVLSIPDWGVTPFAAGQDRAAIRERITAYNVLCHQEVDQLGAHWVDITEISRDIAPEGSLAEDGLHPARAMYARWAAATVPVVQAIARP